MRILGLALPIVGGMLSQNLLNLVDTAMVGVLGNAALAAVGIGGFANFMCQALILGISVGVQATSARRKGEGKSRETAHALNSGLLLAITMGLTFSLLLFPAVPELFPYLNSDPEVAEAGSTYLQMRVLAIVFVGMNFAFRGYWNGVDLSKIYMSTLILMHLSNIFLNYALIFGNFGFPELGVQGAGLGTSISTAVGSAIYFIQGFRYARKNGFLKSFPTLKDIRSLIRLSIPNSFQQLFFATGFTVTYWIIGKIGTQELAAANVLINITLVAILPSIAMGLASATLVGQALGKEDPKDAKQWAWDVCKCGVLGVGLISVPFWVVPELLLSFFLHDPETIQLAKLPMQITGFTVLIDTAGLVLMNSLLGAGDTKRVMIVSTGLQWLFFLPCAYLLGPTLGYGLLAVWLLQTAYRAIQAISFAYIWKREAWVGITV